MFYWEFFRAVELWLSLKAQKKLWQVGIFCPRLAYPALPNLVWETDVKPYFLGNGSGNGPSLLFFGRAGLNLCCCETERTRNEEIKGNMKYIRWGNCPYRLPRGGSFISHLRGQASSCLLLRISFFFSFFPFFYHFKGFCLPFQRKVGHLQLQAVKLLQSNFQEN